MGEQSDSQARSLGFWACMALMVGNFIGSGIFLLPSQLAPLGWNSVLGWLLTIAGALCLAFVFARLARARPEALGPYAYVEEAFGPLPAFITAWAYWIALWVGNTAIATAAISYLSLLAPPLAADPALSAGATALLFWALTLINCLSTRAAAGVQLVTTALKLVPLLVVIVIAALVLGEGRQVAQAPLELEAISLAAVTSAAALTLWAMAGVECAAVAARRVRDPERNIPRATLIGTALVGLIYLLTATPVTLLLPADQVAASNAPFALFVSTYWSAGLAGMVALFAAISAAGALNGFVLLQGELPLAMARAGTFPRWFAAVSARGIPVRAQLLSSGLATVLIYANSSRSLAGVFVFMALLSTAAILVLYLACALAALRLQSKSRIARSAGLTTLATLGLVYGVGALFGIGIEPVAWGLALLASGLPVYLLMRRARGRLSPTPPATIPSP